MQLLCSCCFTFPVGSTTAVCVFVCDLCTNIEHRIAVSYYYGGKHVSIQG